MSTAEKKQEEFAYNYENIQSVPWISKEDIADNIRKFREDLFPAAAIQNPPAPVAPVATKNTKV